MSPTRIHHLAHGPSCRPRHEFVNAILSARCWTSHGNLRSLESTLTRDIGWHYTRALLFWKHASRPSVVHPVLKIKQPKLVGSRWTFLCVELEAQTTNCTRSCDWYQCGARHSQGLPTDQYQRWFDNGLHHSHLNIICLMTPPAMANIAKGIPGVKCNYAIRQQLMMNGSLVAESQPPMASSLLVLKMFDMWPAEARFLSMKSTSSHKRHLYKLPEAFKHWLLAVMPHKLWVLITSDCLIAVFSKKEFLEIW